MIMPGIPDIAGQAGASVCMHAGQGCAILSRVLVPKSQLAEAAEKLKVAMANVKVGDPNDPETVQGPQCSAAQRERVEALIQQGIDEGSTLLCGGGRPKDRAEGLLRRADRLHRRARTRWSPSRSSSARCSA